MELIAGELHELTTNPSHDTSVSPTGAALASAFGSGCIVREEKTLDLGRRYQPHPDAAAVVGETRDYSLKHPRTAVLVAAVAEVPLLHDRVVKAHRFAQAGIGDYWIVNLAERPLEIYRKPEPDPERIGRFRYTEVTIVPADGHASPLAWPEAIIAVATLLP